MEGALDRPSSRPSAGPHPEWLCEMCKVTMIMRVICLYSQDKDFQDRDCPFADEAVALLGQEEELKLNKLWKTLA